MGRLDSIREAGSALKGEFLGAMKVIFISLFFCVSFSIQRSVWIPTYQVPHSELVLNLPLRSVGSLHHAIMPAGIVQATQPIFLLTTFKNSKMSAVLASLKEKTEMSKEAGSGVLLI